MTGSGNAEVAAMDYGKSGAAKQGKKAPRHSEHNAKGTEKNPFGKRETRADLVARMKAAAKTKDKA
jgi:hypothetical protein